MASGEKERGNDSVGLQAGIKYMVSTLAGWAIDGCDSCHVFRVGLGNISILYQYITS